MQKLNPKKAAENPLAATLLASVLLKASKESGDKAQETAALDLLKIAEANQDKMPRLKPNSKLALAIKELKKAMGPQPRVPEQDSEEILHGESPQPSAADLNQRLHSKSQ
jgi:hypothetical protein